jgi:D-sedoheptulose 7-phosphate isomerase
LKKDQNKYQVDTIRQHFNEAKALLESFLADEKNLLNIKSAGDMLTACFSADHKVISCGNGGSMSDAMHFAEELTGKFRNNRKPLPAIAISDPAYLSCIANDYSYDEVFSRFISAMGQQNDVLLAISTSGNSKNIILAAKTAHEKGMKIIGLTGRNGGELASLCDIEIRVPHMGYSDRIQEIHIKVIHILIEYIERKLGL